MRSRLLMLALSVAVWLPATAHARKTHDYTYRFEQVWSAALRMVRVDLRFPVEDRDESIGYILFEYQDGRRSYPGSVELVRTTRNDRPHVRVVVQISAMPSYIEQMLLDRLGRKLVDEFGEPPPPPPRRQPREEPEDEEGDDDEDDVTEDSDD